MATVQSTSPTIAEVTADDATSNNKDPSPADLFSRLKELERELELIQIQEEYIKDEQKNLKREFLRAQEEVC